MYAPTSNAGRPPTRRGVILLVVLSLLLLFAVVGLSFVFYADREAFSARLFREAQDQTRSDMDPELLGAFFLGQMLYDARDDSSGVDSALRGHGLLRGMYGLDYTVGANGTFHLLNNTVAYNGAGRLHFPSVFARSPDAPATARDDYYLVNYTYYPADGFLRDPERRGPRADLRSASQTFLGGGASYTYPDLNNMFLAAVRADGTVLLPSYHRPWTGFGPLDPSNPNWTDATKPWLKYLVLRPRPADHPPMNGKPGFPLPEDAGGDVKNLLGTPGGNDSIWLDLGAPVLTASDGRKYKALFAPLIVDLDGRVNVNAHGNVRGRGAAHVSNQGWGPWEVGLPRVLAADPTEWQNLFRGVAVPATGRGLRLVGRYGPDQQPTGTPPAVRAAFGPTPHFYARVDYDSCRANGTASAPLTMPAGVACFPTFPAGYDNAGPAESTNHPALYNVLGPPGRNGAAFDRRFATSNLAALLRFGDTGSEFLTSELLQLCPQNFLRAKDAARRRRLVTTDSFDPDVPGLTPWAWGGTPSGQLVRPSVYPQAPERLLGGGSKPYPDSPGPWTPYSDFGADGRATAAALGRIDLNRPLPDYPAPDPATGRITNAAGFRAAQAARQDLARDVFLRLVKATGAYDPNTYQAPAPPSSYAPPTPPELDTLRWLAQLAVNVVDYTDSDDYITPFNWGRATGTPAFTALYGDQWVYGTELPHVVLNEAYAEVVNAAGETGPRRRATRYIVNVWAELLNPFRTDASLPDGGAARLDGAYQLVLTRPNQTLLSPADGANVRGDPDQTGPGQAYNPAQVYAVLSQFRPALAPPSDRAGQGFYVIGPPSPSPGVASWNPAFTATLRTPALSFQVPVPRGSVLTPPPPTLLLRRLACPGLPWQPDPSSTASPYNPYVTVDYLENVPLNRCISNTGTGYQGPPLPPAARSSVGRQEPYDANSLTTFPQVPRPALVNQPQHTFFQHNTRRQDPFHWLVHLDRPLVSPMELLHVSCCKPHQLTHLFRDMRDDPYQSYNHAPYWLVRDATSPLSRAFEFLTTGCRAGGVRPGDRIPGKINLNTIWDRKTFLALCDPQPGNSFSEADVNRIYDWMTAGRTPGGRPNAGDRPFKGLGNAFFRQSGGLYAEANGLEDTLLRANPRHPAYDAQTRPVRLFEIVNKPLSPAGVIQDHPYQRYELLTKIANTVTTRSHVFAVWVTVGFFEVNDDTTRPVKLGAELNRAQGRQIRHRLFAIVDRSPRVPLFPRPGQPPVTAATAIAAPGPATVTPSLMADPSPAGGGRFTWSIQEGMVLRVSGPDAGGALVTEDVVVRAVTATTFTASFAHAYPRGLTSISAFGNPGPSGGYNPHNDGGLTPYFSVID